MKRKRGPAAKPLPRLKRQRRLPSGTVGDQPRNASGARRSQAPPFLVAAVGASAGGLEAVTSLLRAIPGDAELAVLIVQHLSRTAKSHLAELLSRSVSLKVVEARDRILIQPRHVYVIPADTRMTVTDGRLSVLPTNDSSRPAVDVLFQSVADQYAERGVAIVLSGGGSDGTLGLTAVKSSGGFTFAQVPSEAKVAAMPQSAIDGGLVDAVLGVEDIAQELLRLARHPLFRGESASERPEAIGEEPQLRRIFQVLRKSSGIDFGLYKPPTILRRIRRRMALHRLNTMEEYARFVQEHAAEASFLHADLLIHVTSFFREPESFEALRTEVFPKLRVDRDGRDPIRVWIPGCSSGEEVYSFAISLVEFLGEDAGAIPVQIFGTDVSERMVDRARTGIYSAAAVADLRPDRLRKFFTRVDGAYRVSKSLRENCIFARQDITQDPPFSKLDLVLCRNLLIYLSESAQRRAIAVFSYAIKAGGYLVLGRSETVGAQIDLFSTVDKRFRIYAKKQDVPLSSKAALMNPSSGRQPPGAAQVVWEGESAGSDLQGEVNRFLVNRYAPPGVVVDRQLRIQRSRGRTSPYIELPAGEVSLEILRMVRQELIAGLRGALNEARIRGATARKENLRFLCEGHPRTVNIEVTPVGEAGAQQFLVVFEEPSRSHLTPARNPASPGAKNKREKRSPTSTRKLEEELAETREHLEAMIRELGAANEELQSSNEEILSSNEELQSTNEELDTAKEELQSANEELNTLNDELEGRNHELTALNGDLHNLLTVVNIPIVIVTNQLLVRRFTPAAERVWNLIPTDTGRPISQVRPNIDCPDLEKMIAEVVETVTPREREVDGAEGRRYTLRVRPYKTLDNKIDGAMLTLFDVTDEVDLARLTAESIMSSVHEPIALLDGDQKVQLVNAAFALTFGASLDELRGKPWNELGKLGWEAEALRKLIEEVLPASKKVERFPIEYRRDGSEPGRLLLDGTRLQGGTTGSTIVLLTVRRPPAGQPAS